MRPRQRSAPAQPNVDIDRAAALWRAVALPPYRLKPSGADAPVGKALRPWALDRIAADRLNRLITEVRRGDNRSARSLVAGWRQTLEAEGVL